MCSERIYSIGKELTLVLSSDNNGNAELIEYLLDSGADLNARTTWGDAAINYAAGFASCEAFRFLLEEGADLEKNEIR